MADDEICLYGQVRFLTRVQYKCKTRLFQSTLFPNNRVDDILTAKYDGFPIQPTKIRSDDDRVLCLDCGGIEPEREGGSFCLSQLFPVTLTVKLILKGGAGVIWLKDEKIFRVCF